MTIEDGRRQRRDGRPAMAASGELGADPVVHRSLLSMLVDEGHLTLESASRAQLVHTETQERVESVLTRLGLMSERRLAAFLAETAQIELVTPAAFPHEPVAADRLSPRFLRDQHVLPLAETPDAIALALGNPMESFAAKAIAYATGRRTELRVALPSDIEAAIDRLYGAEAGPADADAALDEEDLERLKDLASDAPAIRAVNRLIIRAGELNASDIHLEPTEENLVVRFRIDGVMREMESLSATIKQALVSRIKVMAGLNIAERRLPQDGRLRLAVRGLDVDLRIATSPTIHGESVVMRLLDRSHLALEFSALGFRPDQEAAFLSDVRRPHGIILVTGPTGSGKTTTLYAALSAINTPDRKILTIEDPIEYRLAGISQTQVQSTIGLSFATALRSFLRQDPDVVMVGEIRDLETAQVAVQAALTGHAILSTLHTNSAVSAVTRLIEMGVEPFLITSTVNAVLGQRLVRRLCAQCSEPVTNAADILDAAGLPAAREGADFRQPVGCVACGGSGFKGRVAVIELLKMTDAIASMVLRRADEREILAIALEQGLVTMLADGIDKAAAGLTTIDEVLRISREN